MFVLILTLVIVAGTPPTIATADFSSEKNCNDAATKWAMETMKTYGGSSSRFTTVCVAK